jgi:hypothetical protein
MHKSIAIPVALVIVVGSVSIVGAEINTDIVAGFRIGPLKLTDTLTGATKAMGRPPDRRDGPMHDNSVWYTWNLSRLSFQSAWPREKPLSLPPVPTLTIQLTNMLSGEVYAVSTNARQFRTSRGNGPGVYLAGFAGELGKPNNVISVGYASVFFTGIWAIVDQRDIVLSVTVTCSPDSALVLGGVCRDPRWRGF